ncbi:carbohydrate ABC transporter permease [Paenibacillus sp. KN14-4R]|uniref:carbohydrate ABC transporter permease n=1 Tax=Paenibacillus sp. KN14-4R TaxID=3445773 RepID=UPI003FA0E858
MNKTLRNPVTYILFIIPTLLLYCMFFIFPVISTLKSGFTSWDGVNTPVFNGLDNYIKALTDDPIFWKAFLNNVFFIAFSLFIQIPVIIFLGVLVSGVKKFRGFYKTTVFLPSILSTAVVGILFSFVVFHPEIGLLNKLFSAVGLESLIPEGSWLGSESTAMLAILFTNAWQWTGFYVVLVLAAILGISKEVFEAAEIDGATGFQKARLITIPLIRPIILVIMLLSITGAMKALDVILVMTNGGPFSSTEVMATHMYNVAFKTNDYGYGNAIANLIMIFTLGITLLFAIFSKKFGDVES